MVSESERVKIIFFFLDLQVNFFCFFLKFRLGYNLQVRHSWDDSALGRLVYKLKKEIFFKH